MAGIEINIQDMVRPGLEEIVNILPSKAEEAMDASDGVAEIIRGYMVSFAPFKWGDLREGHIVEDVGPLERYIYSDVPHFKWVVEGTPPHEIRAKHTITTKTGKEIPGYLYWEGLEHPLSVVHHPGTAPNNYPSEALAASESEVEARLTRFIDEVLGR